MIHTQIMWMVPAYKEIIVSLGNNARLRTQDITLANAPSRAESFVDSLGLFLVIFLFP